MAEQETHVVAAIDWRHKQERYSLVGNVCAHCDFKIFPQKDVCPNCGYKPGALYVFSGKGSVYTFTTINEAPEGFVGIAPYTVAIVELEEGPKITSQIVDINPQKQIQIGDPVYMVTRKYFDRGGDSGIIVYGYKFIPEENEM